MNNVWFENLCNCMAGQSVVQRVRAAKASDITCLSSACTSDLFVSVIWPRHFATHSLRPQERNKIRLVRSTMRWEHNKLERWGPRIWWHFVCNLEAIVKWYLYWSLELATSRYGCGRLFRCLDFVVAAETELEHPAGFEPESNLWSPPKL